MFGATPPRRIWRSSTRNETASLSSCSTTRESRKRPRKDIRWSVAIEPQISRDTLSHTRRSARGVPRGHDPAAPCLVVRRSCTPCASTAHADLVDVEQPVPSPRAQDSSGSVASVAYPALGRPLVEGVSAGTGAGRVGVVDREALL